MIKKVIFLSLSLLVVPVFAMEEGKENSKLTFVGPHTEIIVQYGQENTHIGSVTPLTTVGTVKEHLTHWWEIPTEKQQLYAVGLNKSRSPELENSARIRTCMSQHGTKIFAMYASNMSAQKSSEKTETAEQ